MIKVKSTTDYSRFKFMRGNRPIDKRVRKMIRAIKRKNMLADFPILTMPNSDGRNFICDGQTRFEAAKQLKLPVFYIESKQISIKDIADANGVQSPWKPSDYVHSFCEQGNRHYLKLREFIAEFNLPITASAALLSNSSQEGGQQSAKLKEGIFEVKSEDKARRVANVILAMKRITPLAGDRNCTLAMIRIMAVSAFDAQRLIRKLELQPTKFVRCANSDQCLAMIEEIYNFRVQPKDLLPLQIEAKKAAKSAA